MKTPLLVWAPPSAHATVWKNQPELLICALQPRQIVEWRAKNRWADALPMVIFSDETPPASLMYSYTRFAAATGEAPHVVVNPPPIAVKYLDALRERGYGPAQAYGAAVTACAEALRGKRCAWIQPESDHCFGALSVAWTIGLVVAYSARSSIDSIGALAAGQLGVNVETLGTIKASAGLDS